MIFTVLLSGAFADAKTIEQACAQQRPKNDKQCTNVETLSQFILERKFITLTANTCDIETQYAQCGDYFAKHPDDCSMARNCNREYANDNLFKDLLGCTQAFGDVLGELVEMGWDGVKFAHDSAKNKGQRVDECTHDMACKVGMWTEYNKREPTEAEQKKLEKYTEQDVIILSENLAQVTKSRELAREHKLSQAMLNADNLGFERESAPWLAEVRKTVPNYNPVERPPTAPINMTKLVRAVEAHFGDKLNKLQCVNSQERVRMVCYVAWSIADPISAYLLMSKVPKTVRFLKQLQEDRAALKGIIQAEQTLTIDKAIQGTTTQTSVESLRETIREIYKKADGAPLSPDAQKRVTELKEALALETKAAITRENKQVGEILNSSGSTQSKVEDIRKALDATDSSVYKTLNGNHTNGPMVENLIAEENTALRKVLDNFTTKGGGKLDVSTPEKAAEIASAMREARSQVQAKAIVSYQLAPTTTNAASTRVSPESVRSLLTNYYATKSGGQLAPNDSKKIEELTSYVTEEMNAKAARLADEEKIASVLRRFPENQVTQEVLNKLVYLAKNDREGFVNLLKTFTPTTERQNLAFMKLARDSMDGRLAREGKIIFSDTENSMMKLLNDLLKDEPRVTAMTNLHKAMLHQEMRKLLLKYKADYPNLNLQLLEYSDFKSSRFAFYSEKGLPKSLEQEIAQTTQRVNEHFAAELEKEIVATQKYVNEKFANEIEGRGLVRTDADRRAREQGAEQQKGRRGTLKDPDPDPRTWFRSGLGDTMGQANVSTRFSRQNANPNRVFHVREIAEDIAMTLEDIEVQRTALQANTQLKGTQFLETIATRDGQQVQVLSRNANDLLKKYPFDKKNPEASNEAFREAAKHRLGVENISDETIMQMRLYKETANELSPPIEIALRQFLSLDHPLAYKNGGILLDVAGMDARNQHQLQKDLATTAAKLEAAVIAARKGEGVVTQQFNNIFKDIFASHDTALGRGVIETSQSGDDVAGFFTKPLDRMTTPSGQVLKGPEIRQQQLQKLADDYTDSAGNALRGATFPEGVEKSSTRNNLGNHGHAIEKKIRTLMESKFSSPILRENPGIQQSLNQKMEKITLLLDMQTTVAGEGKVGLIVGRSKDPQKRLTDEEMQLLRELYREAIELVNKDLRKEAPALRGYVPVR